MKRFFYLVLILVASIMTITFAACGGGDDSTSAGGSGSGGGGSGGGGSTPTANINIIGTWRAYYQRNGVQLYDLVSFNADHTGYVIEEVGNGTDNKNPITWTMTGNVITVKLDGDYVITWTILQVIDDNTVTISDGKRTYNVVRDGTGGGTPATNPVLGTFNFVYQSYYDETPYDYYGGFVTIDEDPYNTFGENSINIANLYLEGSNLVGYYDRDKDSVYIAAWQAMGVTDEYGLVAVNWKETKADLIPFSINIDGSLTSDRFGIVAYDSLYVNYIGWWEAATIATLTPTNSASSRRTSAKRSVTTKIMKIDKGHLSNKRIKK